MRNILAFPFFIIGFILLLPSFMMMGLGSLISGRDILPSIEID